MILKSLGAKGLNSIPRLLSYVNRDAALKDTEGKIVSVTHNLFGNDIEGEFRRNEAGRLRSRSDHNNVLMHTIISLSRLDDVKPEMLVRLAEEFMRMSPNALHYAVVHWEEGRHPHSHILSSGVDLEGRSTRISTEEHEAMRCELERMSRELYSELRHSNAEHGRGSRTKSGAEQHVEREGRVSRKEEVAQIAEASFNLAMSREEFYSLLKNQEGVKVYERGGRMTGIMSEERNYRFSTLGLDLAELDRREERLMELQPEGNNESEKGRGNMEVVDADIERMRLEELEAMDRKVGQEK